LLFGIFVIVIGLRNVGLVIRITELYSAAIGSTARIWVICVSSALGSAVLNNDRMALLNALAICNLQAGAQQQILAAQIGGDLGHASCLSDLWQAYSGSIFRRECIHISALRFSRVGVPLTVPTVALSMTILVLGMAGP
jgi:Na+/H+ antiporter NhaD/arsenite permease-like protein